MKNKRTNGVAELSQQLEQKIVPTVNIFFVFKTDAQNEPCSMCRKEIPNELAKVGPSAIEIFLTIKKVGYRIDWLIVFG